VLSLPEVISSTRDGPQVRIPPGLSYIISPETFFLFNKVDILGFPVPEEVIGPNKEQAWKVSLSTGEGTTAFLAGLTKALQRR
jgi:tRNA modification GTPase